MAEMKEGQNSKLEKLNTQTQGQGNQTPCHDFRRKGIHDVRNVRFHLQVQPFTVNGKNALLYKHPAAVNNVATKVDALKTKSLHPHQFHAAL
ncbi:hypothetical protein GQ457_04G010830 [Hibiscus cannabinus]